MKYIDTHSHIYPDAISQKATRSTCRFYNVTTDHSGTASELLRLDKDVGIVRSVLLPVSVNPVHTANINNFTLRECEEHPEFVPFATMHAIIAGKIPLTVHSGDPRYTFSHPERIRRILHEFPRLTVIAAHMGAWSMQKEALPLLKNEERCFTDTSSALSGMTVDAAMMYINAYGVERVMYGSDYPIEDPAYNAFLVERLPISDGDKEKIAHLNAERIIGIETI